jgi:proliferating cell nuclear antigen
MLKRLLLRAQQLKREKDLRGRMHLRTIQANAIKGIFEVLKDIINDVNVYFSPEGLKILTLDTARVTLVHMNLSAENFEEYVCPREITAGLNMANTFKLLKSVGPADTLTMNITGSEILECIIENTAKKSKTTFSLKLLDINEDILDVPEISMDLITTMPSIDFQRIARDMGNLASDMNIFRDGNILELSCMGDFANQKTVLEFPDFFTKRTGATYNLRYINMFTKATGLCSSVQLMQDSSDENMPIVFRYGIANLGDVKFYLAPRVDES